MRAITLLIILIAVQIISVSAQQDAVDSATAPGSAAGGGQNIIKVNGSAGLSSEIISTTNSQALDSSRRDFASRFSFRGNALVNISIYDQVQLPFELWFTTSQIGFQQPFNQFGVSPRIGNWLVLHAGYFYTKISDLSFGDSRMMGGGIELSPGNFRVSALYGKIRDERRPDSSVLFGGEYMRRAMAFKIGYQDENNSYLMLNLARAWDDTSSRLENENTPTPEENFITSLSAGFPVTDLFKISAEAAVSLFSDDVFAKEMASSDLPGFMKNVFTPRYTTMLDAAFKAGIFFTPHRNYSLRLNAMWVGPGFRTLGYPQMPNDVFDITIAPSLRFLNGDLSLRGSLGLRQNNLRDNHVSDTRRVIGSVDIFSQLSQEISLNAQYSNYGMRTSMFKDTLRIQNISQIFTFSPNAVYQWLEATNNVSLSYSFQDVFDRNSYDTTDKKNMTNTFNLMYSFLFENSLNLTTGLFYNNNISEYSCSILSLSQTAGYAFFEKKLTVSASLGVTSVRFVRNDVQLAGRLSANYSVDDFGNFTLNISNMNYMAGSASGYNQGVPSYNEIQGSLQYGVSF